MVLVCHPHKFIYIKTHKTASTTTEMFLEPFCAPADHKVWKKRGEEVHSEFGIVGVRNVDMARVMDKTDTYWFNHIAARRIRRQLGGETFRAYAKVACIRNPFSRLLSDFFYIPVWAKEFQPPASLPEAKRSFQAYMLHDPTDTSTPMRAKTDYHLVHINDRCVLDHVLRTEHLKEDLHRFLTSVGIAPEGIDLRRERDNSELKRDWGVMDFFDDPELVDRAVALEGWMFELGGYSTDPADA